ncbi:hypothetical protein CS542_02560 [Pedobacter sp. IW39]|nr:hypothetical protein CS542_02560 [Pedobacter sp. IW39]
MAGILQKHRHLQGQKGYPIPIQVSSPSYFPVIWPIHSIKPLLRKVDSFILLNLQVLISRMEEIAKIICTPKRALKRKDLRRLCEYRHQQCTKIEGVIKGMFFKSNGPVSIKTKKPHLSQ